MAKDATFIHQCNLWNISCFVKLTELVGLLFFLFKLKSIFILTANYLTINNCDTEGIIIMALTTFTDDRVQKKQSMLRVQKNNQCYLNDKISYLPIVARVDSIHNWLFRRLGLFLNEEHNGFLPSGLSSISLDNKIF